MALSDAQIDRFSRQIVLPQIGGRGQERLLASSVAVAGHGALAEIVALSLAGAGIGRIALLGAGHETLRADLLDLNPDVRVSDLDSVEVDILVACDVTLTELERAASSGRPLVAGGIDDEGGWLVVGESSGVCASCAGRAATARRGTACRAPTVPAVGIVGSLMSIAILKQRLGLGEAARPIWLRFDARRSMLSQHPIEPVPDCPVCTG